MKKYLRIISLPILLMQTSVLAAQHQLNNETSTDFTDYGTATTFRSRELESLYVQQNDRDDADSYFLTSSKLLNRGDETSYSNPYASLFKHSNESIYANVSLVNDDSLLKPIISPIPQDPSPLIMLKPPRKPTIRGRVELPYINPKELGIVDFNLDFSNDFTAFLVVENEGYGNVDCAFDLGCDFSEKGFLIGNFCFRSGSVDFSNDFTAFLVVANEGCGNVVFD